MRRYYTQSQRAAQTSVNTHIARALHSSGDRYFMCMFVCVRIENAARIQRLFHLDSKTKHTNMAASWHVEILSSDEESEAAVEFSPPEILSPAMVWSIGDEKPKVVVCPVCKFTDATKKFVKLNNCAHIMHKECIPANRKCPLCRETSEDDVEVIMDLEDIPVNEKKDVNNTSTQTSFAPTVRDQGTQTSIERPVSSSSSSSLSDEDSSSSWSSDSDFEERKPPKKWLKRN